MSLFGDANWHPIVLVAHKLGLELERMGNAAVVPCPLHQHEPRKTCFLDQSRNGWYCRLCRQGGDLLDFVALHRKCSELDAAKWVVESCGLIEVSKDRRPCRTNDTPVPKD